MKVDTEALAREVLKVLDGLSVGDALCVLELVAPAMLRRSVKFDASKLDSESLG